MLGEKITATMTAKYYFGAPVTEAKVKLKILRHRHDANWYPLGVWDWFYQPGYWWFACDYYWYPGWREWGCRRPIPIWWNRHRPEPPEVVLENEVPVGKDGSVKSRSIGLAKAVHGDSDHRYEITAEVTDQSRRTIVGTGSVMVARKPFKVYAWVDRGHYRAGDTVKAFFSAQTLDNKPVKGAGVLKLFKISYDKDQSPSRRPCKSGRWRPARTGARNSNSRPAMRASTASATPSRTRRNTPSKAATSSRSRARVLRRTARSSASTRLELVTDKREYAPGETVSLMINTDRAGAPVLLFIRPANGTYLAPKLLRIAGKSAVEAIEVVKKDMPNFFIEALTVHGGKVHTETREIVVPPEKRVVNVEVLPNAARYKPGETARVRVKLTDLDGKPVAGSAVVSVYDKSVEYISGGSNVPEIRSFFWKWRRQHRVQTESSLQRLSQILLKSGELGMGYLGVFGALVATDDETKEVGWGGGRGEGKGGLEQGRNRIDAGIAEQ